MNTARLNQGTPLLLNAVSKHYAENIVLNQLDLHIPAGQFVAVVLLDQEKLQPVHAERF